MAKSLWGKVYLQGTYVGRLQEEPGGRVLFTYDDSYLASNRPAIAYTLPRQKKPHISEHGLHAFFDNLVAEGWLKNAQAKALGVPPKNRLALLLGFGFDLAGAVSVIDPEPQRHLPLHHADESTLAALLGRASLSGVQRKLMVVKDGAHFRAAHRTELSTHIAKLSAGNLAHLIELEFLTLLAARTLLPHDVIVAATIETIPTIRETALIIPRFDRTPSGARIHFEEFNQLFDQRSGDEKYDGSYELMGEFLLRSPACMPAQADRLLQRIFVCLLVGNTDAHLKNFAMFHTADGLRLTPAYDLVAAALYPEYQTIALRLDGARSLAINQLQPKHLLHLSTAFGVNAPAVTTALTTLATRLPIAIATVLATNVGTKTLREKLARYMEKRWRGSFASIGRLSSPKPRRGAKRNG